MDSEKATLNVWRTRMPYPTTSDLEVFHFKIVTPVGEGGGIDEAS